jgi:hypothetical protein
MNEATESTNKPAVSLSTITGGTAMVVTKLNGETENVRVRQLPVNLLPEMLTVFQNEPALVELYCERPAGWAATLSRDSYEAVVEKGQAENGSFFARWLARHLAKTELIVPNFREDMARTAFPNMSPGLPTRPT